MLDVIADESLRILLAELQDSINAMYQAQRSRVSARGSPPSLHFDYIQATVTNAVAFEDQGYAFVGFTMPLVDEIVEAAHSSQLPTS